MTLHCHSTFSQLDGIGLPERHAQAAKDQGLEGLAITDHALTSGWLRWEEAFKKEGLNPLFGVETYFAPDRHIKTKDSTWGSTPAHLLLLAKNREGLKNINRIVTDSYMEGFYGKPRTDLSVLREHSEGIIATSSCVSGPAAKYFLGGHIDGARSWIADMVDIFNDDFFLEIQPHPFEEQVRLNEFLCSMDLPLICTNDSHYARTEDAPDQQISVCVATGKTLSDPNRMDYEYDFSVKGYEQIWEELQINTGVVESAATSAVENTRKLIQNTTVELPKGLSLTPDWDDAPQELRSLLTEGLERKVPKGKWNVYKKRLRYEYDVVVPKGFAEYFLVVADMVRAAKKSGVFVGAGRGSAGGSLIAYLLDITEVDPIKWDLNMERFISPSRGGYEMSFHSATEITEMMNAYEERFHEV